MRHSFFTAITLVCSVSGALAETHEVEYRGSTADYAYVQIIDAPDGASENAPFLMRLCHTNPCDDTRAIVAWPSTHGSWLILANPEDDKRTTAALLDHARATVHTPEHRVTPDF